MKIAAFNVKNLGLKKVTNKTVVCSLTKIISRYSVVVLLEVMDKSGKAMDKLLQELNNPSLNQTGPYCMIASSPLGRDSYKEQFVCFYRADEVTLRDHHQYEDNQSGDVDAFAREPLILRFSCPAAVVTDLVLIPVHTKPDDAQKELDELHDVVDDFRRRWRTDNIMILGDFNADGRYLSKKKKKQIRICSSPYHWLIDDDVDTTSSNCNDHTYDRIVVYGQTMRDAVVPGSAKPFNFQRAFRLTNEKALSISDHYPVEVELKTRGRQAARRTTSTNGQTRKRGPQKKTKAASAGFQKNKEKMTTKRKRGISSETPAKRRRHDK